MIPLLVLAFLLLALWGWGVWERDARAAFMREWQHVPLLAGLLVLVMAIGSAIHAAVT